MINKVTIVMYHYVRSLANSKYPYIKGLDKALFKDQIGYLKKHYNFITMEELIASLDCNSPLPKKAILLTFDDGYKDHFSDVYPLLLSEGIQGSFYPPAKAITENKVLDVNKIHFVLASVKNKKNLVNEVFNLLNQFRGKYNLESNNFYYEKLAKAGRYDTKEVIFLKRILQVELEEELRLILTDLLFKKFVDIPEEIFSKDLYMNINEIKIMKKNGMHIGSHGFDHYWLNSLTKNVQEDEIKKSLIFLKLIGCDLENWTMCYPYGAYNQDTLDLLEMYNCKLALTTKTKVQQIDNKQRYEFGRLDTNDLPKDINSKTKKWYNQA